MAKNKAKKTTDNLSSKGRVVASQKVTQKSVTSSGESKVEEFFQKHESTISLILGVVVVLISAVLLFRYIKVWKNRTATLPEATSTTELNQLEVTKLPEIVDLKEEDGKMVPNGLPTVYVVQKGDSTWKVAKAFYGSGYNYVDIEKENKLKHNQYLEVGMKLTVPKVEVIAPTETVKTKVSVSENKVIPETYTVQKGDYLWKLAVEFYGNGFDWLNIYNANKDIIKSPNSIDVGMTLTLPRK